jgi:uncharacterized glyoxalase superfamily protein PhnB
MTDSIRSPITPYLTVRGAAAAIDFYRDAFGATERMRMPAEDGERLLHAELALNGGVVYLSDEFPEHGGCGAPGASGRSSVAISLALKGPQEVDATHARALAAGATAEMGPMDAFWGARFATLRDPFGHRWMLSAPLAD